MHLNFKHHVGIALSLIGVVFVWFAFVYAVAALLWAADHVFPAGGSGGD